MDRAGPSSAGLLQQLAHGGAGALVAALDHLLEQNDWARQRLAMHVGRTILIGVDMPTLRSLPEPRLLAVVAQGGRLKRAEPEDSAPAAVTMLLRPSIDAAFDFFRGGAPALSRHLRMEGDVLLAGALGEIVRHLRWDATEDLSRFTGDVVAERIARLASGAAGAVRDAGARLESSAARYLSVESGQLVDRAELETLAIELDALEQRLDGVSRRVQTEPDARSHAASTPGPYAARPSNANPAGAPETRAASTAKLQAEGQGAPNLETTGARNSQTTAARGPSSAKAPGPHAADAPEAGDAFAPMPWAAPKAPAAAGPYSAAPGAIPEAHSVAAAPSPSPADAAKPARSSPPTV